MRRTHFIQRCYLQYERARKSTLFEVTTYVMLGALTLMFGPLLPPVYIAFGIYSLCAGVRMLQYSLVDARTAHFMRRYDEFSGIFGQPATLFVILFEPVFAVAGYFLAMGFGVQAIEAGLTSFYPSLPEHAGTITLSLLMWAPVAFWAVFAWPSIWAAYWREFPFDAGEGGSLSFEMTLHRKLTLWSNLLIFTLAAATYGNLALEVIGAH